MKSRGTPILLGLFFLGMVGYWYLDRGILPERERKRRAGGRVLSELLDTRPDDLRMVVIRDPKEKPVVFERRGPTAWQMLEPIDVAADPSQVETLAFTLKEMTRIPEAGAIEDTSKLADYGLASPEKTIELWGQDLSQPLVTLDFGARNVNRRFVKVRGRDAIEVVDGRSLDAVDLPVSRWRDHQLLRLSTFQIAGLTVKGEGRDLQLRRSKDHWRINQPAKVVAEDARVESLLSEIASLKVANEAGFVADDAKDLAAFGLDTPRATVSLSVLQRDGSTKDVEFQVGKGSEKEKGKVYVKRSDQDDVLLVDGKALENLGREFQSLRSQRLFDFLPAVVTAVEIQTPEQTLVFAKERREWSLIKPGQSKVEPRAMADFLKQLAELQTSVFLDEKSAPGNGLDSPGFVIKAWVGATDLPPKAVEPTGPPRGEVRLGRRDAGKRVVYARLPGDESTVLAVPDKFLESVPRSAFSMRERIVLRLDPAQLDTVTLDRHTGSLSMRAPSDPSDGGLWQVIKPNAGATDPETLGRLFALLTGVPAEAYIAENVADLSKYGLKVPALRFSWTSRPPSATPEKPKPGVPALQRGPETGAILLGEPVPGKDGARYAMIEGKPTVFAMAGALVRIFEAEFRDRLVVSFPMEKVKRVVFRWPNLGLALVPPPKDRAGEPWQFDGPIVAQPGFDTARVGGLVKLLSDLKTERFTLPPGKIPADTGLDSPRLRIEIYFDEGIPPRVLRLGRSNGNGSLFSTNEPGPLGPVFLLGEDVWNEWLRPAKLGDELPSDVFAK